VRARKRSSLSRSASSAARRDVMSVMVETTPYEFCSSARRRKAVFTDSQVTVRSSRTMPTT
jgi:hypothetical protein